MKKEIGIIFICITCILQNYAQLDSIDYFGQENPGKNPVKLAPGFISLDNRFEAMPVFSPDGKEFYFTVTDFNTYCRIMVSKFVNNVWTEPEIAEFSGQANSYEWGNCFSPDGNTLYFNSSKGTDDLWKFNIWYQEKHDSVWSSPKLFSDNINSLGSEVASFVSGDSVLYFRTLEDIYYSEKENGEYNTYKKFDIPVNSSYNEENIVFSDNGDFAILHTRRYNNSNVNEIVVSFKKSDGGWTNPKLFPGEVNEGRVINGSISPDNKYLIYERYDDIYWIELNDIIDSLRHSNYAPYLNPEFQIPDTEMVVEDYFTCTIDDSMFIDDDGNETLTISVMMYNGDPLPDWLDYNPESKTISGDLTETGAFNIKVTATDTAEAAVSDVFKITVEDPISIQNPLISQIKIYPNPTNGILQIENVGLYANITFEIYSPTGQFLQADVLTGNSIDLTYYSKGIYLLRLNTEDQTYIERILVE